MFETTGMNAAMFLEDVSMRSLLKSMMTPKPSLQNASERAEEQEQRTHGRNRSATWGLKATCCDRGS